jgi:alpha-tubulin suppressor-like RCC1 family protein
MRFEKEPGSDLEINNMKIKEVASQADHTVIVTECGKVFSCGSYQTDKLGLPPPNGISFSV